MRVSGAKYRSKAPLGPLCGPRCRNPARSGPTCRPGARSLNKPYIRMEMADSGAQAPGTRGTNDLETREAGAPEGGGGGGGGGAQWSRTRTKNLPQRCYAITHGLYICEPKATDNARPAHVLSELYHARKLTRERADTYEQDGGPGAAHMLREPI